MRQVNAKRNYLLLHYDGTIHYAFSKYLTKKFNNPCTRETVVQALRILYVFFIAHGIELVVRAAEGLCLTFDECMDLAGLCYRPLEEIETLSSRQVVLITSAKANKAPESLPSAVEPNTALKRLNNIANYLLFYFQVILEPSIRSETLRQNLRSNYNLTAKQLQTVINGTKQGHHHEIQSLPKAKFLQIIKAIFLRPEELFLTESGKPSRTLLRDRAMALLACEGPRPGTLGNIARLDFRPESLTLAVMDNRDKRCEPTTSSTPVLKLGASTQINSASETMNILWPFTVDAINEYINTERHAVLSKHLKNQSKGFLFLNEKGQPIKHRSSITAIFSRLGKRLAALKLLDVGNDPYFKGKKQYDFYAYVCRHSSATLFAEVNGTDDKSQDKMKARYGWTLNSKQPQRYAARAMSDQASISLMEFNDLLMSEVRAKRIKEQK
jgi:hypothetical protein